MKAQEGQAILVSILSLKKKKEAAEQRGLRKILVQSQNETTQLQRLIRSLG